MDGDLQLVRLHTLVPTTAHSDVSLCVVRRYGDRGSNYYKFAVIEACTTCCEGSPGLGYIGALRDDTVAPKVLIVPRDSISEVLLYDFSVEVGDTVDQAFPTNYSCGPPSGGVVRFDRSCGELQEEAPSSGFLLAERSGGTDRELDRPIGVGLFHG